MVHGILHGWISRKNVSGKEKALKEDKKGGRSI